MEYIHDQYTSMTMEYIHDLCHMTLLYMAYFIFESCLSIITCFIFHTLVHNDFATFHQEVNSTSPTESSLT